MSTIQNRILEIGNNAANKFERWYQRFKETRTSDRVMDEFEYCLDDFLQECHDSQVYTEPLMKLIVNISKTFKSTEDSNFLINRIIASHDKRFRYKYFKAHRKDLKEKVSPKSFKTALSIIVNCYRWKAWYSPTLAFLFRYNTSELEHQKTFWNIIRSIKRDTHKACWIIAASIRTKWNWNMSRRRVVFLTRAQVDSLITKCKNLYPEVRSLNHEETKKWAETITEAFNTFKKDSDVKRTQEEIKTEFKSIRNKMNLKRGKPKRMMEQACKEVKTPEMEAFEKFMYVIIHAYTNKNENFFKKTLKDYNELVATGCQHTSKNLPIRSQKSDYKKFLCLLLVSVAQKNSFIFRAASNALFDHLEKDLQILIKNAPRIEITRWHVDDGLGNVFFNKSNLDELPFILNERVAKNHLLQYIFHEHAKYVCSQEKELNKLFSKGQTWEKTNIYELFVEKTGIIKLDPFIKKLNLLDTKEGFKPACKQIHENDLENPELLKKVIFKSIIYGESSCVGHFFTSNEMQLKYLSVLDEFLGLYSHGEFNSDIDKEFRDHISMEELTELIIKKAEEKKKKNDIDIVKLNFNAAKVIILRKIQYVFKFCQSGKEKLEYFESSAEHLLEDTDDNTKKGFVEMLFFKLFKNEEYAYCWWKYYNLEKLPGYLNECSTFENAAEAFKKSMKEKLIPPPNKEVLECFGRSYEAETIDSEKALSEFTQKRLVCSKPGYLGVDIETDENRNAATIQLSADNWCAIIDVTTLRKKKLHEEKWFYFFKTVFDENIIRVGFDFENDFKFLLTTFPFLKDLLVKKESKVLDLVKMKEEILKYEYLENIFAQKIRVSSSLAKLSLATTGFELDKTFQISEWGKRPLKKMRKLYAFKDAVIVNLIREKIDEKLKSVPSEEMKKIIEASYLKFDPSVS